jgi:hypothetical protein
MKIFPDDITPEEEKAGFELAKAKTGYGNTDGSDEEVTVVIKSLSHNRRYIKVNGGYMLQELDPSKGSEQLDSWSPRQDLPSDLDEVRKA